MAHLIFVRHGNTFEAGETARWVGARTDLPLTAQGEEQGEAIARLIEARFLPLDAIFTSPLIRTRRFAEKIAARAKTGFSIDDRLKEIDYGLWENKSSEEICTLYGKDSLEAWEKEGLWPQEAGFNPTIPALKENIGAFLAEQRERLRQDGAKNRVCVTSNGILRFVFALITGEKPSAGKVKTGGFCVLAPTAGGWQIESWNEKP